MRQAHPHRLGILSDYRCRLQRQRGRQLRRRGRHQRHTAAHADATGLQPGQRGGYDCRDGQARRGDEQTLRPHTPDRGPRTSGGPHRRVGRNGVQHRDTIPGARQSFPWRQLPDMARRTGHAAGRSHRRVEHHDGHRARTHHRDWHPPRHRRHAARHPLANHLREHHTDGRGGHERNTGGRGHTGNAGEGKHRRRHRGCPFPGGFLDGSTGRGSH